MTLCPTCNRKTLRRVSDGVSECRACGCKVPTHSEREAMVSNAKATQIKRLRRSGLGMLQVARHASVSLGTVQRVLNAATARGTEAERWDRLADKWSSVLRQINNGNSLETIAKRYGVTVEMLRLTFPNEVQGLGDCRGTCGQCVRCKAVAHQRHQRPLAEEHQAAPTEAIDDPREIAERTAAVRASWSEEEAERRRVEVVGPVELIGVSVLSMRMRRENAA